MGLCNGGLERVTLNDLSNLSADVVVLGVDSALAYHGFSTDPYIEKPVILSDKIPPWKTIFGDPRIVGVPKIGVLEDTRFRNVKVTGVIDSILDTMQYNEYSEGLLMALRDIEGDKELCDKLKAEAEARGVARLLEWEWSEMHTYFNY